MDYPVHGRKTEQHKKTNISFSLSSIPLFFFKSSLALIYSFIFPYASIVQNLPVNKNSLEALRAVGIVFRHILHPFLEGIKINTFPIQHEFPCVVQLLLFHLHC